MCTSSNIVENLLFLVGWARSIKALETFHNRFWSRVRQNRKAPYGYRSLTIGEYHGAYMVFQQQWRKASKANDHVDDAILASQPPGNDELDGRLALAPRLAGQPATAQLQHGPAEKRKVAELHNGAGASSTKGPSRRQKDNQRIHQLNEELAQAHGQQIKGSAKGGGNGKSVIKGGKGASWARESERRGKSGASGAWCRHFISGDCKCGERCFFRHT